ncbi:MAG: hypothetical protein ACTHN3_06435 [Solirubrobacterales bacterium]
MLVDLGWSAYAAASVRIPDPVPDYALQAPAAYRLEVGAACFVVLYLAAMAFFLALDGRGFVELGTRGLKADQVVRAADDEQEGTLAEQIKASRDLEKDLEDVRAALQRAADEISAQDRRLEILETQTIS